MIYKKKQWQDQKRNDCDLERFLVSFTIHLFDQLTSFVCHNIHNKKTIYYNSIEESYVIISTIKRPYNIICYRRYFSVFTFQKGNNKENHIRLNGFVSVCRFIQAGLELGPVSRPISYTYEEKVQSPLAETTQFPLMRIYVIVIIQLEQEREFVTEANKLEKQNQRERDLSRRRSRRRRWRAARDLTKGVSDYRWCISEVIFALVTR